LFSSFILQYDIFWKLSFMIFFASIYKLIILVSWPKS
jgi:hypothetical protein